MWWYHRRGRDGEWIDNFSNFLGACSFIIIWKIPTSAFKHSLKTISYKYL